MARRIPQVVGQQLTMLDEAGAPRSLTVDGDDWFAWLADDASRSFSLQTAAGAITFRRERQRNGLYWYAYHGRGGKLRKAYAGRAAELTLTRLHEIAGRLVGGDQGAQGTAGVEIDLLGPPRFIREGHAVQLPAKASALLGYVAVQEQPPTREQLMALLWPESSPDAARKNLRNLLWTVRAGLGAILETHTRIGIRATVAVDVRELLLAASGAASGARAVERYGGLLLDGLELQDAPDFELWLTAERERLSQLYLRLVQRYADAARGTAQWHAVIDVAQRGLRVDPLHEPLHRTLIEAYARLGERAEALRRYEALRLVLDRELGVLPLPETEALQTAVRDGVLDPVQPRMPRTAPLQSGQSSVARAEPFVGRYTELAILDAALADTMAGRARVVTLVGELGIGKTRLWREWSRGRRPEVVALEARCLRATQDLPFAPLLDPGFMEQLPAAARALLRGERTGRAPRLERQPERPATSPAAMPLDEERHQIFEACAAAFAPLLTRPVVFFVDNLQWADPTTLAWLGYLVRRYADRPLLVVVAQRVEEAEAQHSGLLVEWERGGVALRLPVPRLTVDEAAVLLEEHGYDRSRAAELHTQSGGNPYYLSELARVAPGDVPPVLDQLVRDRIEQLPAGVRQILQAAVVLEPDIDFATLRRTSGRDEEETLDALDALLQAGLIAEHCGHYAFGQPFLATVVRSTLSSARQAVLHRRAAEAQAALHAGALGPIAAQLMEHYLAAGDAVRAAQNADLAAEHALQVAATTEAIGFYRRALELAPSPARQISLGNLLSRAGSADEARERFAAALAGAEADDDRLRSAQAMLGQAMTYLTGGYGDEVVAWAGRALRLLEHEHAPAEQAYGHMLLGAGLRQTRAAPAEAEAQLREAIRLARSHRLLDLLGLAQFDLGNLLAERGQLEGALEAYRESIGLAQSVGNHWQETLSHNNAAYHALLLGQLPEAHGYLATALDLAERYQLDALRQWLFSTRGEIALAESAWSEAEHWFEQGERLAEQRDNPELVAGFRANRGLAAWGRDDATAALELLEDARTAASELPAPYLQTRIDLWLAERYLAQGTATDAEAALARAEQRIQTSSYGGLAAWAAQLRQQIAGAAA